MDVIEYKSLAKVKSIEGSMDFTVFVELSAEPSVEWWDRFRAEMRLSPFCPACARDGETGLAFVSGHAAIQYRIDGLRRVISRVNNTFRPRRVIEVIPSSGKAVHLGPTAEEIEAALREDGY